MLHGLLAALLVVTMAGCRASFSEAAGPDDGANGPSTTGERDTTITTRPTTTTERETTTMVPEGPTPDGPIAPLLGLPAEVGVDLDRPALVLKVDNHTRARPQTGLAEADIVFDMRAEGVTRFAAVYHSRTPPTVGPVRSSRTSDFDLLRGLDQPLYGSSGGNANVMAGLQAVPVHAVTNHTRGEYFRDRSRPAPHNLYVHPEDLYALAPGDTTGPEPWFDYRPGRQPLPSTASPVTGEVTVAFTGGPTVGFTWDGATGGWLRTQNGSPHLTAAGDQLAPENVVIMITTYGASPADARSPEVRSTGGGDLVVLTAGHAISGTWERPASDPPTLLDDDGEPISLTPGRTWVLLPESGQVDL